MIPLQARFGPDGG